jgi:hypothetical protein
MVRDSWPHVRRLEVQIRHAGDFFAEARAVYFDMLAFEHFAANGTTASGVP